MKHRSSSPQDSSPTSGDLIKGIVDDVVNPRVAGETSYILVRAKVEGGNTLVKVLLRKPDWPEHRPPDTGDVLHLYSLVPHQKGWRAQRARRP